MLEMLRKLRFPTDSWDYFYTPESTISAADDVTTQVFGKIIKEF